MSFSLRALVVLVPVLSSVVAADPETPPAPAKVAPIEAKDDGTLNNVDLRLIIGGGGSLTRVTNEDTDVDTDYDDGSGGTIAIHALYLRARPGGIGFAVGGGLFSHRYDGEPEHTNGPTTTVNAAGIDLTAAFVYRPTRNWHFELPAVVLSGGGATVEIDGAKDVEDGTYGRIAIEVGAYYTFNFGLQLGVNLGGAGFSARFEDQEVAPNVKQEVTYHGGGGYLNLLVGYRF